MNGIIYHTRSFSIHDGPGIRKAIFLKGCPLSCKWCHNPESISFKVERVKSIKKLGSKSFSFIETIGKSVTIDELLNEINEDIPFFDESGGGVTLTGGEPLAQPDFAIELLKACKAQAIHTSLDTSGYTSWSVMERTIPYTDLYLYDLKFASSSEHLRYCGVENTIILENLAALSASGKPIIIRIPLIDGITDTDHNILNIKRVISSLKGILRIDLLPYHNLANHKFEKFNQQFCFDKMPNYSQDKAKEVVTFFKDVAPIVSIGG